MQNEDELRKRQLGGRQPLLYCSAWPVTVTVTRDPRAEILHRQTFQLCARLQQADIDIKIQQTLLQLSVMTRSKWIFHWKLVSNCIFDSLDNRNAVVK